jgi:hypothetical protein
MDDKQTIAVLLATLSIQKERVDKLEDRVERIEKNVGEKLDLLISESHFVKGILKAISILITIITVASPFVLKFLLG